MTQAELQETVERLIDQSTLDAVLAALAAVCYEKAEHLAANWQDKTAAREWSRAGNRIDNIRASIDV